MVPLRLSFASTPATSTTTRPELSPISFLWTSRSYANVAYGVLPSRSVGGTFVLTDLPAIQQISLLLQRGREEQKGTILVLKTQRKILDLYISSSAAYRNL
jgi:hypothetical protein